MEDLVGSKSDAALDEEDDDDAEEVDDDEEEDDGLDLVEAAESVGAWLTMNRSRTLP